MQFLRCLGCVFVFVALVCLIDNARATLKLCGRELPEALDNICVDGYNGIIKRNPAWRDNDVADVAISDIAYDPFLSRLFGDSGHQFIKMRRRRFGISDECCAKPCTYAELKSYCRQ